MQVGLDGKKELPHVGQNGHTHKAEAWAVCSLANLHWLCYLGGVQAGLIIAMAVTAGFGSKPLTWFG
jgi:hypothetical protein